MPKQSPKPGKPSTTSRTKPASRVTSATKPPSRHPRARATQSASQPLELRPWTKKELKLALPHLKSMNPGLAFFFGAPEVHDSLDGDPLTVLGTNTSGLWFVLADDGSIHLVDDVERELGTRVFASVEALVDALRDQNRS